MLEWGIDEEEEDDDDDELFTCDGVFNVDVTERTTMLEPWQCSVAIWFRQSIATGGGIM